MYSKELSIYWFFQWCSKTIQTIKPFSSCVPPEYIRSVPLPGFWELSFRQGCQMVCFQTKTPQFWSILEGLAMVNLYKLYDHLVYFTAIENILWPFGSFCGHLVHFPCFGILYKKSGNPGFRVHSLMRLFLPKQTFSNESRKFSAKKTLKGSFFPYLNKVSFVKFYLPFHLILLHNKKYIIL
jgi:hypothetical protein